MMQNFPLFGQLFSKTASNMTPLFLLLRITLRKWNQTKNRPIWGQKISPNFYDYFEMFHYLMKFIPKLSKSFKRNGIFLSKPAFLGGKINKNSFWFMKSIIRKCNRGRTQNAQNTQSFERNSWCLHFYWVKKIAQKMHERERRCVYTLRLSVKFMIKELIVEHFTIEESSHKIVSFWKTLPWIHNTIFSQFLSSLVWRSCQKLAVKHYIWFRGWIEIQIFVYFQCKTTFNAFRSTLLIINFPLKNVFTTFWCCFYKRSHNFHPLGFSLKLTVLLTQTWNF